MATGEREDEVNGLDNSQSTQSTPGQVNAVGWHENK